MMLAAQRLPSEVLSPASRSGLWGGRDGAVRRILVVEDDILISMDIEAALEEAGYQVVGTAISAAEAVALALQHEPDLVVMDVRLQGDRDGIDAARIIHAEIGVRSLFISANDDAAMRQRASAANPAGWLSKPFMGSDLVAFIGRLRL